MTVKSKNLVGLKIGTLIVISELEKKHSRRFMCRCDCGTVCEKNWYKLNYSPRTKCDECVKKDLAKRRKLSQAIQQVKIAKPIIHKKCGELISQHRVCKKCKCIMCEKSMWKEHEHSGLCTECI